MKSLCKNFILILTCQFLTFFKQNSPFSYTDVHREKGGFYFLFRAYYLAAFLIVSFAFSVNVFKAAAGSSSPLDTD